MTKVYFDKIHLEIIHQITNAQFDIKVCIAWFTDFDIYKSLVKKVKEGINVEVIIANHKHNKKSRVNFKELLKYNGKVSYIGNLNDGLRESFMHNKFCIIDNIRVVTGSYNWSYKARKNEENILVLDNNQTLANKFIEKFNELKPKYGFTIKNNEVALLPIEKIMSKWDNKPSSVLKPSSNIVDKF
ncbi:phospholipase D-like domain-containing protein [Maribacter dokdonensis]|uniref:phospholipase D-like domain-containing protein n=1 Tax=Maribacter dokdonensis TaxID=320912 RepID=UPI0007198F44|nr:phospholipase D-like domain-containing protein [Maribacter dokdonensis]KSA13478.1 Heat shock protein DnaJ domain protein [Maribacter dokdonensis DSW-8]